MSQSIRQFNALNGTVATRENLEQILNKAKIEEQTHIAEKLQFTLDNNPDSKFDVELQETAFEIVPFSMLNGLHFEEFNQEKNTGLNKAVTSSDIYQMITDKMLQMIKEASGKGYVQKWKGNVYGTGYTIPFNFDSKKRYRGVNVFLLTGFEPLENPFFMTFKQIEANKGKLKKGSHGSPVIYFTNLYKITDKARNIDYGTYDLKKAKDFAAKNGFNENDIDTLPILKYYNVFNGKDIEGIDFDLENFKIGYIEKELPTTERLPIADAIVENYPAPAPPIKHGGNEAFYAIGGKGYIQMPHMADFETAQDYYRTLFHELSHSTGDFSRLNRKIANKFGTKDYAFEELVAEWGATFLSAEAGIICHTNKNHAEYLKNWNNSLVHLKDDNKFIMKACTLAQKLTDYILQFDENGTPLYLKNLKVTDVKIEVKKERKTKPKRKNKEVVEKIDENGQYGLFGTFPKFEKLKDFCDFAYQWAKENLSGKKYFHKGINKDVHFTNAGTYHCLRNNRSALKTKLIFQAFELLKKSKLIVFEEDKKNRKEIAGVYRMGAKTIIDGINYDVILTLRQGENGIVYYDHKASEIKKVVNATESKKQSVVANDNFNAQKEHNKSTKKIIPTKKNDNKGLKSPSVIGEIQPVASIGKIKPITATGKTDSVFFKVNGAVGEFLQAVERKPFESVVITMDGQQGAGKTTTLYKFIDAFASAGNKSLFISGEEHPESALAVEKRDKYLSNEALQHTSIVGDVDSIEQLYEYVAPFEIIFIDSWQKLQRMVGAIRLDEDLRKKFNGKVFVVIFQQTTTGRTKGGAEVVFDGDIIIKMVKENSFADNYAYFDKNRYTKIPIENIRYNIASGTVYNPNENVATEETATKTEAVTEVEPIEFSFEVH